MNPVKESEPRIFPDSARDSSNTLKSLSQRLSAMRRNSAASCVLAVAIALGAPFAWAQAQTGDKSEAQKLTEIQNAAMKAFQQGNWGEAASGFEKLLREAPMAMQPLMGT